jgi:copper chaperone NosL
MSPRAIGWRVLVAAAMAAAVAACGRAAPRPAELDTRNEQCRFCSMVVSSRLFAAQIVAPGEEPKFFDDLGCLGSWLKDNHLSKEAAVFVADHRSGEWVPGMVAVYSRVEALDTPMNSHLVAHATDASRSADRAAAGGVVLSAADAIGLGAGSR